MALNYLAPAPYAAFVTRNGAFQADANALISNVGAGPQALDLVESGCVPLAFNPFANFRNLIDGGDFSINPFQRNIPGLAAGGVIATPIGAAPELFRRPVLRRRRGVVGDPHGGRGRHQRCRLQPESQGLAANRQHELGDDQLRASHRNVRFAALPGTDGHAFVLGQGRGQLFRAAR